MPYNTNPSTISNKLIAGCGAWRNVDVWDYKAIYTYYSEGRDILLYFKDKNEDMPQFTIHDSVLATTSMQALSPNYIDPPVSSEHRAYSDALFYEPIPFEMLYTDQMNP